nr:integrase, catalytic region, zinc finger, CCHC-type, peptidase aspartic, catalytic [Tanacetum cinerariifolium]
LLEKREGLETKLSKSKMMSKSFESVQKHAINLELELQQRKEKIKNDMLFKDFSKPVTAQTLHTNKKSILKNTNVLAPGMYKLHTDHTQTRTSQLHQDSRKTNKRVSFSTGVIPTTSVSRPQLKSIPMGDRVMRNNSQGKKQEVEDQSRNVKNKTSVTACNDSLNAKTLNVKSVSAIPQLKSIPMGDRVMRNNSQGKKQEVEDQSRNVKNKTSVTACNDSLNAKTLNVKSVSAMCDKCVLIDKHAIDLVQGAVTIKRVYYVEGLNHNLFSVDQFCDADLEVAFRKSTC